MNKRLGITLLGLVAACLVLASCQAPDNPQGRFINRLFAKNDDVQRQANTTNSNYKIPDVNEKAQINPYEQGIIKRTDNRGICFHATEWYGINAVYFIALNRFDRFAQYKNELQRRKLSLADCARLMKNERTFALNMTDEELCKSQIDPSLDANALLKFRYEFSKNYTVFEGKSRQEELERRSLTADSCHEIVLKGENVVAEERRIAALKAEQARKAAAREAARLAAIRKAERQKELIAFQKSISELQPPALCEVQADKSRDTDFRKVATTELSKRQFSKVFCQSFTRFLTRSELLTYSPSKDEAAYLSDLNLCGAQEFRKPPHIVAEIDKRKVRCDKLIQLDRFERGK